MNRIYSYKYGHRNVQDGKLRLRPLALSLPLSTLIFRMKTSTASEAGAKSQATFRAEQLKEAFMDLKRNQKDVLDLFKSVSDSINACPDIGDSHRLATQWQNIRQVRQCYC